MFVDELTLEAKAGNGGDGVVRWLRLRAMPLGGPAGGNGGNGGNVLIRSVRDLGRLSKYTGEKMFRADDGEAGKGRSKFGRHGEDYIIDLPIGSKVTDLERKRVYLLEEEGQTIQILRGGRGGLGNEMFKSATNRSPEESTKGTPGEAGTFSVELTLGVDVGLIGLPNAGKSTLLNAFTNATSRIGAYPFTTTEPHLGDLFGYVLADIPGLIAGASEGKGLGHKFLRHVGRAQMLLHLVSLENEDVAGAYGVVKGELEQFDPSFLKKEEWIILTKADLGARESLEAYRKHFEEGDTRVFVISALTGEGMKELQDALIQHLRAH